MNKKIMKARRLLDYDKYHLNEEFVFGNKNTKWKLFEKYDGWMTDGSEPIMTSEKNTEKELLKFAKKHKEYKIIDFYMFLLIIPIIALILSFINIKFHSELLRGITYGFNICTWIIVLVDIFVNSKNYKVFNLELEAQKRRFIRSLEKKYNDK